MLFFVWAGHHTRRQRARTVTGSLLHRLPCHPPGTEEHLHPAPPLCMSHSLCILRSNNCTQHFDEPRGEPFTLSDIAFSFQFCHNPLPSFPGVKFLRRHALSSLSALGGCFWSTMLWTLQTSRSFCPHTGRSGRGWNAGARLGYGWGEVGIRTQMPKREDAEVCRVHRLDPHNMLVLQ